MFSYCFEGELRAHAQFNGAQTEKGINTPNYAEYGIRVRSRGYLDLEDTP
jgi:hypothetical protein